MEYAEDDHTELMVNELSNTYHECNVCWEEILHSSVSLTTQKSLETLTAKPFAQKACSLGESMNSPYHECNIQCIVGETMNNNLLSSLLQRTNLHCYVLPIRLRRVGYQDNHEEHE